MAEGKKSAVIYCDLITTVEKMKDVDAGKLLKHFLRYINDLDPAEPKGIVGIVFEPIKQQLKRDLKKWETKSLKNAETAKARWEKMRNDANALSGIKKDAKSTDTDNVTVTVTVNDTDNVTDTEKKTHKQNLIEIFFNDLETCSQFETIAMRNGITKDELKTYVEPFKLKAELSYPTFDRFMSHFKNYVLNERLKDKPAVKKRNLLQELKDAHNANT